jgi:hypothetical protein
MPSTPTEWIFLVIFTLVALTLLATVFGGPGHE